MFQLIKLSVSSLDQGKYHFFIENLLLSDFFSKNPKKFQKLFGKLIEKRNLNFVTSELDSESLSTLRNFFFKRDSCKVDDGAAA